MKRKQLSHSGVAPARWKTGRRRRGFTLIEMLVAMLISGLIIGAALGTYVATSRSWETSRARSRSYQRARVALSIMERYIQAAIRDKKNQAVVFEGTDNPVEETGLEADSLTLVTTGDIVRAGRRSGADLCEVKFYTEQDAESGFYRLILRKHLLPVDYPDEGGQLAELASDVISFDLSYFDGYDWVSDWTLREDLPEAVFVSLVFFNPDDDEGPLQFSRLIGLRAR